MFDWRCMFYKLTQFPRKLSRLYKMCLEEAEAQKVEISCLVVPSQGAEPRPTIEAGWSRPSVVWRRLMWLCSPCTRHCVDSVSPVDWLLPLLVLLFNAVATQLGSSLQPMSTEKHDIAHPGNQSYLVTHPEAVRVVCLSRVSSLSLTTQIPTPKDPFLSSRFLPWTAGWTQHCVILARYNGAHVLDVPQRSGLNGASPIHVHLKPQNVTLFGNRVFADVSKD